MNKKHVFRFGGTTANSNNPAKPMNRKYSCSGCGRKYAMEWAKNNHQKLCLEHKEAKR